MKRVLINAFNTRSAGTAAITRAILKDLSKIDYAEIVIIVSKDQITGSSLSLDGRHTLFVVPRPKAFFGFAMHIFVEFFLLPVLYFYYRPSRFIALANYALCPLPPTCRRTVILRQPHIVEPSINRELSVPSRSFMILRRWVFGFTVVLSDIVVCQTENMYERFTVRYPSFKRKARVLANPVVLAPVEGVSSEGSGGPWRAKIGRVGERRILLFVSRYYKHKNHKLIVEICEKHRVFLKEAALLFVVTLEKSLVVDDRIFLERLERAERDGLIVNLGEVPPAALGELYGRAEGLFFPSLTETFGNPLLEAMHFGCPIVVSDRRYARDVCESAALFFDPASPDDAVRAVKELLLPETRARLIGEARLVSQRYQNTAQWMEKLLAL